MSLHTPARITGAVVQRMARLGGLQPCDRVAVTGPGGAEALCALCRLGFDEVLCLGAGGACLHGDAPPVALLIPDRLSDLALMQSVRSGVRWVPGQAAVMVRLRDVDQDLVVQSALEQAGFHIGSAVFDLSRGALVSHTVSRVAFPDALAA